VLVAVGGGQERVLVPIAIAVSVPVPVSVSVSFLVSFPVLVPFPFSVSVPIPLSVAFSSVFALGFGSVWLVARAIVDNIDIAIFRGRHDEPCQGVPPALKTGNCGGDNRRQLQPESWVAAQGRERDVGRRWSAVWLLR
jgi:hypothetical protein